MCVFALQSQSGDSEPCGTTDVGQKQEAAKTPADSTEHRANSAHQEKVPVEHELIITELCEEFLMFVMKELCMLQDFRVTFHFIHR